MELHRHASLAAALILAAVISASAQVEKVAMRTTGISCGACAAVSEIYLKRLESVDKVTISMANEAVTVSYKAGATFNPSELRQVLKKTEVGVVQFQISARGRVQEQEGKRVFVAGKDKFLVIGSPASPPLPSDTPISVEGVVNDKPSPMELKILSFTPVKP